MSVLVYVSITGPEIVRSCVMKCGESVCGSFVLFVTSHERIRVSVASRSIPWKIVYVSLLYVNKQEAVSIATYSPVPWRVIVCTGT